MAKIANKQLHYHAKLSREDSIMDRLQQAVTGFQTVDADPTYKEQAAKNLARWLNEPEFAPYQEQIEWLIDQKKWTGLLDRFYQIIPFGTGGRPARLGVAAISRDRQTRGRRPCGH